MLRLAARCRSLVGTNYLPIVFTCSSNNTSLFCRQSTPGICIGVLEVYNSPLRHTLDPSSSPAIGFLELTAPKYVPAPFNNDVFCFASLADLKYRCVSFYTFVCFSF